MGESRRITWTLFFVCTTFLLPWLAGCQLDAVAGTKLVNHRLIADERGLGKTQVIEEIEASCAPPVDWEPLPLQSGPLYKHQQWRSKSHHTGVGVVYIRLPLPLSAKTLEWLAVQEYTKKSDDGKIVGQWADALGREWFEGETQKYRVRGYIMTRGFDAWINYTGYRVNESYNPDEVEAAHRSMETMLPLSVGIIQNAATRPSNDLAASQ